MRRAGGIAAAVVLGQFGLPAGAQDYWHLLLDCAATLSARIEYVRVLDQAPDGHVAYLKTTADLFLSNARELAPPQMVDCDDSYGLAQDLVICYAPPSLFPELHELTLTKLTRLVEENGGTYPLPSCMEDAECSACMRLPFPEYLRKSP